MFQPGFLGQLLLANKSSVMSSSAAPRGALRWREVLGMVSVLRPRLLCEQVGGKDKFATLRAFSSEAKEDYGQSSVAYLTDTLGFSPESAKRAAKHLKFKTPDTLNSVLDFFKNHGLSHAQVLTAVRRCPGLLMSDPEKTLLPKLEFFYSVGASSSEVVEMVCANPSILTHSLARTLVPSFNYYEGLFGSKEKTFHAMRQFGGIQRFGTGSSVACNLQVLRDCGVPDCKLHILLKNKPFALNGNPDTFKRMVERIREMEFDPTTTKFVDAVIALESNRSTWDRKVEAYRQWGWSDEDLVRAFRLQPSCMQTSEEKIATVMNILVKEMGFEPSAVASCPVIFGMSLRKRIRPRAAVAQALLSKGLPRKKNISLRMIFYSVESEFLKKLVHAYEDSVPDLLYLYRQKLNESG